MSIGPSWNSLNPVFKKDGQSLKKFKWTSPPTPAWYINDVNVFSWLAGSREKNKILLLFSYFFLFPVLWYSEWIVWPVSCGDLYHQNCLKSLLWIIKSSATVSTWKRPSAVKSLQSFERSHRKLTDCSLIMHSKKKKQGQRWFVTNRWFLYKGYFWVETARDL